MHGRDRFVAVPGGVKRFRGRRRREPGTVWRLPWQNQRKPWFKAPRAFRNALERRFRRRVRELMHHERYEDLPATRQKDADWLWS